jgi:hypothetical protein
MLCRSREQIATIDENLRRENLSTSQKAIALKARQLLCEMMEQESAAPNGAPPQRNAKGGGRAGVAGNKPGSTRDIAAKTGLPETTVRRSLRRADALGDDALQAEGGGRAATVLKTH